MVANQDLKSYLEPWAFGQLNVVEKVLLAQHVAEEFKSVQRLTRENLDMLPPNPNRFDFLFMTALYGGTLGSQAQLGVEAEGFGRGGGGFGGSGNRSGLQNVQVGGSIQVRANYFSNLRTDLGQVKDESDQFQVGNGIALNEAAPPAIAASEATSEPVGDVTRESRKKELDTNGDGISEKLVALGYTGERNLTEYLALYQPVRKTEEWVENNYFRLPIAEQNAGLIPISAFWADYAQSEPGKAFRSVHIAEIANSFTEILLALAVLDLPFEAPQQSVESSDSALNVKAASPMLVFYKDVALVEPDSAESTILIGQNYFRLDDRYRFEGNQQYDKFVKGEFVAGVTYGCQVTVTNPTSRQRQVELLHQIPQGALPVGSGRYTKSDRIGLEAYNTATLQFLFYFPKLGEFEHYPAHVSEDGKLLAFADPQHMKVVEIATEIDTKSWQYIAQQASNDQVLEFLNEANLNRVDLSLLTWRLRDRGLYDSVLNILQQRHVFQPLLWSYAVYHNDPAGMATYLRYNDNFVAQSGAYFDGPLLTIDPAERKSYQHVEYVPLINPRAHQLNSKWTITNDQLRVQYESLMNVLAHRTSLDQNDFLAVTYYLLLQDRTAEALEYFKQVAPEKLETRLQYDYFATYLAFSQGDAKAGIEIASRYAGYPVTRWQALFAEVVAQGNELGLAETQATPTNDRPTQDKLAKEAPRLELHVNEESVVIQYANVKECQISLYPIDLESLFTRSPFELARSNVFAGVKPATSQTLQLDSSKNEMEIPIDPAYANAHVVIKTEAAGISRSDIRYASKLIAQLAESYGQIQVFEKVDSKPLPKVYIKVFARMKNGEVLFYRDGYTDLRGRFDYASSSTLNVGDVSQFRILVLSDDRGARVLSAEAPAR